MVKDMNDAFGEDVAEKMRLRKLTDETLAKTEVRWHPDLPDDEARNSG